MILISDFWRGVLTITLVYIGLAMIIIAWLNFEIKGGVEESFRNDEKYDEIGHPEEDEIFKQN